MMYQKKLLVKKQLKNRSITARLTAIMYKPLNEKNKIIKNKATSNKLGSIDNHFK